MGIPARLVKAMSNADGQEWPSYGRYCQALRGWGWLGRGFQENLPTVERGETTPALSLLK